MAPLSCGKPRAALPHVNATRFASPPLRHLHQHPQYPNPGQQCAGRKGHVSPWHRALQSPCPKHPDSERCRNQDCSTRPERAHPHAEQAAPDHADQAKAQRCNRPGDEHPLRPRFANGRRSSRCSGSACRGIALPQHADAACKKHQPKTHPPGEPGNQLGKHHSSQQTSRQRNHQTPVAHCSKGSEAIDQDVHESVLPSRGERGLCGTPYQRHRRPLAPPEGRIAHRRTPVLQVAQHGFAL